MDRTGRRSGWWKLTSVIVTGLLCACGADPGPSGGLGGSRRATQAGDWGGYRQGEIVHARVRVGELSTCAGAALTGCRRETGRILGTVQRSMQHAVLRVRVHGPGVVQVLPDGAARGGRYAAASQLRPIPTLAPIAVTAPTRPLGRDVLVGKAIVVLQDLDGTPPLSVYPELWLLEGNQLVMRVPVGVMAHDLVAERGALQHNRAMQVFEVRGRRHMSGGDFDLPGVGFTAYFLAGGYALHDSYWQGWETTTPTVGFHGTHGCINLPSFGWYRIAAPEGHEMSASELAFRWLVGHNWLDDGRGGRYVPELAEIESDRVSDGVPIYSVSHPNNLTRARFPGSVQDWDAVRRDVGQRCARREGSGLVGRWTLPQASGSAWTIGEIDDDPSGDLVPGWCRDLQR